MALKGFIRNFTDSVGLTYEEEEVQEKETKLLEENTKKELLKEMRKTKEVKENTKNTKEKVEEIKKEMVEENETPLKEDFIPPFIANTREDNTMSEDCNTIFVNPKTFSECRKIADYIKNDKIVTLNLEDIDYKDAQRILDFLSGAITIKEARWIPISRNVFTSVPKNINFFYDGKNDTKNNFFIIDKN